jgi:hypothetical protein
MQRPEHGAASAARAYAINISLGVHSLVRGWCTHLEATSHATRLHNSTRGICYLKTVIGLFKLLLPQFTADPESHSPL